MILDLLLAGLLAYALWTAFLRPRRRALPESEARAILGVPEDADAEAIRAAHRRLAAAVHPDRGGSAELMRRINGARDALLRRRD